MSGSDSSSYGGEYKNLKQISRERLLHEMLRSAKTGDSKSTWKVLIMDKLTVKIMSHSCKMADITDEGVSLVEDIYKRRQPLPTMDAIYFIQPTRENVIMFLSDMSGRKPLYRKAFVFFSSPIAKELVLEIKKDTLVLPRIGALREVKFCFCFLNIYELYFKLNIRRKQFHMLLIVIFSFHCAWQMNLEYFAIDSQGFITNNERALEELYGDEENNKKAVACLNVMATRVASVFASLREFPFVRFHAARSLDANTMTTFHDLIPTKLAAGVWDSLMKYKKSIPNFPQTETCELLIIDRTIDQIAPLIHEWTYDAMCHDLLNMEGNKYVHEIPGKNGGQPERKEVLLEDHDPIWLELRYAHIADASERLHEKMTNFISKNKAAQIQHGSRGSGEMSTRDLQKMVQALPQYSEQIDKLSLHVEIAGKVNRIIRESGLRELGQLEQDLVFGDAGMKDVIKFLTTKEDTSRENKLRLLMILAAIYPEKFEGEKGLNLMKVAKLTNDDAIAINNLRVLGGEPDAKKTSTSGFALKFDMHKKKRAVRKNRAEEETWQLSRFYPIIEELVEKVSKNELSNEDYPCLNDPSPSFHGTPYAGPATQNPPAHSLRSRRTPTWARPRGSDDGYSSDSVLKHTSSDFKKMGQRIFIFIVGGATRSELRICHKLTNKLKREVILGSSSLDDPAQFITKLKMLTMPQELSLDDLQI
ncbi:SNARE-interacting protein KEULE-like isoform X1 [Vicia villosa]|uniref:SNARE-interacting protein KEULE-like isoform X1 n=1 Tax=Vicia villosa TaxID=3911 RepID=UPI00273AA525|nr:SNARE-interacting protein KEULE-like isoform X1 [Vicia villosa]XP_058763939.1 SNARE-interacting protein KEULE-like isoform X1 [Vicia villosa]XP_058764117.1 SNARE-interacting protein KEULE-like isoform X1 [Vicia villosa]